VVKFKVAVLLFNYTGKILLELLAGRKCPDCFL